jgi:hypothetical protein
MVSMQSQEKKKKKVISSQTSSNHLTRTIQRERKERDESNNTIKTPLELPESTAHAS